MSLQFNMSEPNLSNGLPPSFVPLNGVESTHSSPAHRINQIPASQLPPSRTMYQENIKQIAHNYSNLNISQVTPISSPKTQKFSTSTPNEQLNSRNLNQFDSNKLSALPDISEESNSKQGVVKGSSNDVLLTNQLFNDVPFAVSGGQSVKNNNLPYSTHSNAVQHGALENLKLGLKLQDEEYQKLRENCQQEPGLEVVGSVSQKSAFQSVQQHKNTQPTAVQTKQSSDNKEMFKQNAGSSVQHSFMQQHPGLQPPQASLKTGGVGLQQQPSPRMQFQQQNVPLSSQQITANFQPNQRQQGFAPKVQPPQQKLTHPQPQHQPSLGLHHNSAVNSFSQSSTFQPTQNVSHQVPPSVESQATKVPPQYFHPQPQGVAPFMPKMPPNPQQQSQGIVQQQPQPMSTSSHLPLRPLYNFQQSAPPPPTLPQNQPSRPQQMLYQPPPPHSDPNQPFKTNLHANRYPTSQAPNPPQFATTLPPQQNQTDYHKPNVVQAGFTKLWGQESFDLLEHSNILPPTKIEPPRISLGQEFLDAANCSPDIFRCTMTKIPETNTLLQKSRLPLGVLIHPFKDLDHLPVIQCNVIVRCRACRTYINPFVFFIDMKRWKCNLCYRVNELPEEFQFDPVSKTYGDPSRRPEIKSSTIEYIAPSEYMLRPPQPAVYVFLLDVSHAAIESGYLKIFCDVLADNLAAMPGDGRTQIGFVAYNSAIHFYSFADGLNRPHEMTILDIEDVFLPCPDNLLVNLNERREMILDLLHELPTRFSNSYDTGSGLGGALQIAHKLIMGTGGRVTVFQSSLPNCGPGALTAREDPNQRASTEVQHLNPANDFYKRLALECSGQQIAVDLFVLNSQYVDLATISGISKFSGGCVHHYPLFKADRVVQAESLERCLKRYLTRKIGFEAVMRIRCTRGLSIHTFHGNFFVRSTDLLSLPNINPEAGFGMQVAIDESLSDLHTVCFQAALLYTSSKGERRIRVHTLCLPIVSTLPEVLASADQQCIVGLLAKMAVDRSTQSSLVDSREAFINVAIDILSSYKLSLNMGSSSNGLVVSHVLKLLPMYISALLKHLAFRTGTSTRLDDRVKAMCDMKTLPLYLLIQQIYPDLYPIHNLEDQNTTLNVDGDPIPQPPRLQLSARCLDSKGAFLMDAGESMTIFVGPNVSPAFLKDALGVPDYNAISEQMYDLPILNTPQNLRLNNFINYLNDEKPFPASLHIIRENSQLRNVFLERLVEDRVETALSYHEFLQHLKTQVK